MKINSNFTPYNSALRKFIIGLFASLLIASPTNASDNPLLIYRAYPNLEALTLSEFADACVN